jgi:tetratricopeptide (TPR) repeat protein
VLGAAALAGVWLLRPWLARRARLAYAAGVALVFLALLAVVGHGVYHGTLPSDSLAFRWRYWLASARLFAQHPLLGVGWENFGPHYLSVRLPAAAEEIKDPHNFLVRFATELGAVGLALVVTWMLWLWWDLGAPRVPADNAHDDSAERGAENGDASAHDLPPLKRIGPGAARLERPAAAALATVVTIAGCGVGINLLASIDWVQNAGFVAIEVMRRIGFVCLFVVGAAAVALRSVQRQELDDRPAPWVLYAMLVALGLFLVHNLVDFSLFEPGPLSVFAFVCGAALGIRTPHLTAAGGSPRGARGALVAAAVAWLVLAFAFAAPVAVAEEAAADGDDALRARRLDRAADDFERALSTVPYNADYAFRAARALLFGPDPRPQADRVIRLLDGAVALDPNRAEYWLSRANAELLRPTPDAALVRRGYERALRLDPNNVQVRLDYAAMLTRLGDPSGARDQYEAALRQNDLLSPDEPKRLPPAKLEEVRKAISDLSTRVGA